MINRYTAEDVCNIFNQGVQDTRLHYTVTKLKTLHKNGLITPSKDGKLNVYNAVDMMLLAYARQAQQDGFSTQSRKGFLPKVKGHLEAVLGQDPNWEDCGSIGFIASMDNSEIDIIQGDAYKVQIIPWRKPEPKPETRHYALGAFVSHMAELEHVSLRDFKEKSGDIFKSFYAPKEVAKLVDVSYRQIQYWDKTHFIRPSYRRRGKYRLFTLRDVFELDIAARLRKEENISVQHLRDVLKGFHRTCDASLSYNYRNVIFFMKGNDVYLIDGKVLRLDPGQKKKPFILTYKSLINRSEETFNPGSSSS